MMFRTISGITFMALSYFILLKSLDVLRVFNLNDEMFDFIMNVIEETSIIVYLTGSVLFAIPAIRYLKLCANGYFEREAPYLVSAAIFLIYSPMMLVSSLSEYWKAFSPYLILFHTAEYVAAMYIVRLQTRREVANA